MIFSYLLAITIIFYLLVQIPLGRLTHNYDVFVAADAKTVWDTYFIHVRGSDYRPKLGWSASRFSPRIRSLFASLSNPTFCRGR